MPNLAWDSMVRKILMINMLFITSQAEWQGVLLLQVALVG
jgi:hypothetical protein